MTEPRLAAADLYDADLARLRAIAPHHRWTALWRWDLSRCYTVVAVAGSEEGLRVQLGSRLFDACRVMPVADVLKMVGE